MTSLGPNAKAVLGNSTKVSALISYHLVPGVKALSTSLSNGESVPTTLKSKPLKIRLAGGKVEVVAAGDTAAVVRADIQTCTGVIHAVDHVLLPRRA